jgi:holo-[acyl-carrier protein] synthase
LQNISVGVDIIEISRVAATLERFGNRFLQRIYTTREIAYCRGRAPQLAARFAAKEAVMKALGTGARGVVSRII